MNKEVFASIFTDPTLTHAICPRCHTPIVGALENLTCITDQGGNAAHFYCYYPHGVADRSLELRPWAMAYLAELSPERARFFVAVQP